MYILYLLLLYENKELQFMFKNIEIKKYTYTSYVQFLMLNIFNNYIRYNIQLHTTFYICILYGIQVKQSFCMHY